MAKKTKQPQLTISLLASDRPDTIRRCLDSLQPLREALSCELILVDTSNNPEINKILWEYTDQVYKFTWCNDFAKARNEGLKRAKGEWFLFLDDDEWFVDTEDMIHFFQSGEYKNYGLANYRVRSFFDVNYTTYSDSWVSRLIRLYDDTEFKGKIHEYFGPVRGKRKDLTSMVHHSGYIFETPEKKHAHYERNMRLLLEMEQEEPENMRWKAQIAQEYHFKKNWKLLRDYCKQCIDTTTQKLEVFEKILFGTFFGGYIEALEALEEYEEAIVVCKQALEHSSTTDLLRAFVCLRMSDCYFWLKNWEESKKYGELYLKYHQLFVLHEKEWVLQKQALIVRTALDEKYIKRCYALLMISDMKMGSLDGLYQYYDKWIENKWDMPSFSLMGLFLGEAMATLPYNPIFSRIVTDAYKDNHGDFMLKIAKKWEKKSGFLNIMNVYAQADVNDRYIWYARIQKANADEDSNAVEKALQGFFKMIPNVFLISEIVSNIAQKHQIPLWKIWKETPADKWKANVKEYVTQAGTPYLEETQKQIEQGFTTEDWRRKFFELCVLEKQTLAGPQELGNLSEYYQTLRLYLQEADAFYSYYYKEDVLLYDLELLPIDIREIIKIKNFSQVKSVNEQEVMKKKEVSQVKQTDEQKSDSCNELGKNIESSQSICIYEQVTKADNTESDNLLYQETTSSTELCMKQEQQDADKVQEIIMEKEAFLSELHSKLLQKEEMEKMVLESMEEDYDSLVTQLHHFMVATLEYYLMIFKDRAFEGEMELLPPEARASVHLNNMFSRSQNDWDGKLADLREVVGSYSALSEKVKQLIRFIGDMRQKEQIASANKATSELMQMVEIMKQKIRLMAEQGMKEEALSVLSQIRTLVPEDEELREMEKALNGIS